MKVCKQEKFIIPFLMQELSEAEKTAFADHLAVCPTCSHDLEQAAPVHRWLDHQVRQPIPRQIEREYQRALRRQFQHYFVPLQFMSDITAGITKWFFTPKPLPRLVQAVALLLLGIWIGHLAFAPRFPHTLAENMAVDDVQMISGHDLQLINEYMIRSELILLTIVNSSTDSIRQSDM
ncbi:MAG: zf-HC2 domain-containing protein, partial [Calditrichaeota bacterium]